MIGARKIPTVAILAAFLSAGGSWAEALKFRLILDPGDLERAKSPVEVRLAAGRDAPQRAFSSLGPEPEALLKAVGSWKYIPAQVEILPGGAIVRFVAERLKAGKPMTYELVLAGGRAKAGGGFKLAEGKGFLDLIWGGKPVWRHMTEYDPTRREETYKPYLHLFDVSGRRFITKGPGGLYSHHRGIFLGWNRTEARGKAMDFWHCPDVAQKHAGYIQDREHLGPVMGRAAFMTDWLDGQGRQVVRDIRETSTWRLDEQEWLLDWRITLKTAGGQVELGGDPQHAGFQFRAAQEVADRKAETIYIRPAEASGGENDVWENCGWAASRFEIAGRPYAVLHMNDPANPTPTVYSTRDYGRFGAFFAGSLKPEGRMNLRYGILVLGPGARPARDRGYFEQRYMDFTNPVACRISRLPGDSEAVNSGERLPAKPPPGALVLFDGNGLNEWIHRDGGAGTWPVKRDCMETSGGDLMTKRKFNDFLLHLEFLCPGLPKEVTGQKRSNSGVYIQRRYEIQILDSYGLEPGKGDCGAIYGQKAPDFNACRPPDSWQSYDITFRSPRWDKGGDKAENARITVFHNGLLIHDDVAVTGKTGAGDKEGPDPGPILLQDHGDDVLFRNVWIVPRDGG